MIINFSNHSTKHWEPTQLETAVQVYGSIIDVEFPVISPYLTKLEIDSLAIKHVNSLVELEPQAIHIMGELNFTLSCVEKLKKRNIKCVASTSERETKYVDCTKISIFRFVQFREY